MCSTVREHSIEGCRSKPLFGIVDAVIKLYISPAYNSFSVTCSLRPCAFVIFGVYYTEDIVLCFLFEGITSKLSRVLYSSSPLTRQLLLRRWSYVSLIRLLGFLFGEARNIRTTGHICESQVDIQCRGCSSSPNWACENEAKIHSSACSLPPFHP